MRRFLKTLHTLAAIGMGGALACHLALLGTLPAPESLEAYMAVRHGIAAIARYLLLPSLGLVLVSGLLAMASGDRYYSAGWALAKLASGVLIFEGTLLTVQGPAERADRLLQNLAPDAGVVPQELQELVAKEWYSLWVILALVALNVVLGVWRPRFSRKKPPVH